MLWSFSAILGIAFLVSELALGFFRRSSRSGSKSADGGSLRLLWVVITLAVIIGIGVARSGVGPRICPPDFAMGLFIAGFALFALGAALRWWAIWRLGRFFTIDVSLAADHRVIDDGPYRRIRHPSYLGSLMEFAGLMLTFNNWLALPVVLVPVLLGFLHRIRVEEKALLSQLGESYAAYMQRTGRLLPRF